MIKFKWEKGNKYLYFANEKELAKELRKGNVDEYNELSDDFIIAESYSLGEWEIDNYYENEYGDKNRHENLDPTPKEWEELKKNLPQFFKEAIQFAITMGIVLMFGAFVILQIIKLLHNIL